MNRGGDGTVPRTGESPFIGRDGRTSHADDPATGLRRGDAPAGTTTPNGTTNEWRRGRAVDRGLHRGDATQAPATDTPHATTPDRGSVDRNRGNNNDSGLRRGDAPSTEVTPKPAPAADGWRGRAVGGHGDTSAPRRRRQAIPGSRDVPRRIIDGIGGARISHGETPSGDSGTRTRDSGSRDSGRSTERSSPPPSHSEPSHSEPSHSEPSHVDRSSPPPASHDSGSHESHQDSGSKSKKD